MSSRYPPPAYPKERSRSPPRFGDRRPSAAASYNDRPPPPARSTTSEAAPRGPRASQYDSARPPLSSASAAAAGGSGGAGGAASSSSASTAAPSRAGYSSLREAPPLGTSGDRGRPYRERDFPRDRVPSPRERSPPGPPLPPLSRGASSIKDSRDYPPPREVDIGRARRDSRDGPLSAGSAYSSENQSFSGSSFRGSYPSRGRPRGDFGYRGGRGGRPALDDRDLLFRRDRSPPPPRGWGRDLSRDGRDPERRDDRRFDRRDDDRRPDWNDRERDIDRGRRELVRPDARPSNDAASAGPPPSQALPMDPARRAMLESSGADTTIRRPSIQQDAPGRRDQPDTPSYLNGRAETTANRYGSRGSSPPTQAPPVPAFSFSLGPSSVPTGPSSLSAKPAGESKAAEAASEKATAEKPETDVARPAGEQQSEDQQEASTAPKDAPSAPKALQASPPPTAPTAPQALRNEEEVPFSNRLQGVRSLESLPSQVSGANAAARNDSIDKQSQPSTTPVSPTNAQRKLPLLNEPVSPNRPDPRFGEIAPPTGPRATRMSPGQQPSISPRPPFTSPRSDTGGFPQTTSMARPQTPPPSAPSGPRHRSFSVSPKVPNSSVPTAPKADRAPPVAPRGLERNAQPPGGRPAQPWAPPSAPRSLQQQQPWNQWRRAPVPGFSDRGVVPAKRDAFGEEKARGEPSSISSISSAKSEGIKAEEGGALGRAGGQLAAAAGDAMDIDRQPHKGDSSARQSFFGQPAKAAEEEEEDEDEDVDTSDIVHEPLTSSDEDESDLEDDITLFNAKFERQKRNLEAQMIDLSRREYRATTPLESIARLARISVQDWERFKEQRANEMDVDEPAPPRRFSGAAQPSEKEPALARTAHSSDSGEGSAVVTPKDEDDAQVDIRGSDDSSDLVRRVRRPSPEPVSLPYLLKDSQVPFHESEALQETLKRQEMSQAAVLDAIADELEEEENEDADIEDAFARAYRQWREECEDLDRARDDQERLERQQSLEPSGMEIDSTVPAAPLSAAENRRLHISSEYEMLKVLKESEEMARVEQERQDREAKKIQADMEKEAIVPDQLTPKEQRRAAFIDSNRFRDAESLTLVFTYEPPADDFDDNEQAIFAAAFKETPKKWGEIASLLPNRTYKDCIHHYYAKKWDGRFRDWKGRRYNGRRGRGGKGGGRGRLGGLMADLARTEVLATTEVSSDGNGKRPKRAAAPTTFAEKEIESKASLTGVSPAKKGARGENGDGATGGAGAEKTGNKRQRRTGEKPGRKPKNAAQSSSAAAAAALAAPSAMVPPGASPNKQLPPGAASKDELLAHQKLEEASLLTGLHTGYHDRPPLVYQQDGFMHIAGPPPPQEDVKANMAPSTAASKPSASSYWSVPEQSDFVKYIGHFGRDFAAIAQHMGTKTQTMIKNHFQRQVEGGNKPDLVRAADEADQRRVRGEEIGPPPTPTPHQKRKYEQPQTQPQSQPQTGPPPRALAPHAAAGDPMDLDDPATLAARAQQQQPPKHASPPQYQPSQGRYAAAASQGTPIQAARGVVAPSPHMPPNAPVLPQGAVPGRPMQHQHPLTQPLTFQTDPRSAEAQHPQHQPQQAHHAQALHSALDAVAARGGRGVGETRGGDGDHYLKNLVHEEQERAHRLQQQQDYRPQGDRLHPDPATAERMESIRRQASAHRTSQGSPLGQSLIGGMADRKPPGGLFEERAPSPHRAGSSLSRPPGSFESSRYGGLGGPSAASSQHPLLSARPGLNPSPPKPEDSRPGSVPQGSGLAPAAPSAPPTQPAAEAPPKKRSNLLDLLNGPSGEPAPRPKVENAPTGSSSLTSASPAPFAQSQRREGGPFGQQGSPSYSQTPYNRPPYGQTSSTPAPHESSSAPGGGHPAPPQAGRQDWASRVLGLTSTNSSTPPPANSLLDRDSRQPYYSHRNIFGGFNPPSHANPSPPPHPGMNHSRTPSLSGPPTQLSREQRSALSGQQSQQPLPPNVHPNPYASQNSSPYTQPLQPVQQQHPQQQQPPPSGSQQNNPPPHSHSPITGPFPSFHHRGPSRAGDEFRQQEQAAALRDREDYERCWRQEVAGAGTSSTPGPGAADRRYEDEQHHQRYPPAGSAASRRQHEQEMQQQQQHQQLYGRPPPGAGAGSGGAAGQGGPPSISSLSQMQHSPYGGPPPSMQHQPHHHHHHHHHHHPGQQQPPPAQGQSQGHGHHHHHHHQQQQSHSAMGSAPTSRPGTAFDVRGEARREMDNLMALREREMHDQRERDRDRDREMQPRKPRRDGGAESNDRPGLASGLFGRDQRPGVGGAGGFPQFERGGFGFERDGERERERERERGERERERYNRERGDEHPLFRRATPLNAAAIGGGSGDTPLSGGPGGGPPPSGNNAGGGPGQSTGGRR